jgi:hypothetical protein
MRGSAKAIIESGSGLGVKPATKRVSGKSKFSTGAKYPYL